MSNERLEEIKQTLKHPNYTEHNGQEEVFFMVSNGDLNWLIQQAEEKKQLEELVKELEKERSQWKGKHSILKRKYIGLQKKMNNRWRYNRAVENESKANRTVLEKFREENQRYKQALEFYADTRSYEPRPHIKLDRGKKARQALEGDTNA